MDKGMKVYLVKNQFGIFTFYRKKSAKWFVNAIDTSAKLNIGFDTKKDQEFFKNVKLAWESMQVGFVQYLEDCEAIPAKFIEKWQKKQFSRKIGQEIVEKYGSECLRNRAEPTHTMIIRAIAEMQSDDLFSLEFPATNDYARNWKTLEYIDSATDNEIYDYFSTFYEMNIEL
jgi:hypothetical protein